MKRKRSRERSGVVEMNHRRSRGDRRKGPASSRFRRCKDFSLDLQRLMYLRVEGKATSEICTYSAEFCIFDVSKGRCRLHHTPTEYPT